MDPVHEGFKRRHQGCLKIATGEQRPRWDNLSPMTITLKTAQDIEGMRVACRLASEVLDYITPFVKPGITTNEIDKLCHDYMVDVQGCIPAP